MKKIIILTSKGGHGHMAACATLQQVLRDYELVIVNPLEELLGKRDIVKIITFGAYDGEQLYDKLLQYGWLKTLNFFLKNLVPPFIRYNYTYIQRELYALLLKEKPALLISVMPIVNYPANRAAQQYGIPFLLMTLDADLTLWLLGLERATYANFHVTVPCKTSRVLQQLTHKKIAAEKIHEVGFPFRPEFLEEKSEVSIKQHWNIPTNKPIVMLMMGGAGSIQQFYFTKQLLSLNLPIHLLICIGRNTTIRSKIEQLKTTCNSITTLTIIPFTKNIADLMAISDLLITKPGPTTCSEAMYYGIPILTDMTKESIFWERATLDWIDAHGNGAQIKKISDLSTLLPKYLNQDNQRAKISNLSELPDFATTFNALIHNLVQ